MCEPVAHFGRRPLDPAHLVPAVLPHAEPVSEPPEHRAPHDPDRYDPEVPTMADVPHILDITHALDPALTLVPAFLDPTAEARETPDGVDGVDGPAGTDGALVMAEPAPALRVAR